MKKTVVLLILAFSLGCSKNHIIVTRILPNGSYYREFLISPDSALMTGDTSNNKIPVIIDSSWKVTWSYYSLSNGKKSNPYPWPDKKWNPKDYNLKRIVLVVRKDFSTADQSANSGLFNNTSWKRIHQQTTIKNKFRWFYTEHQYKDLYPAYNPFRKVPVSNYVTDDEIGIYTGEKPHRYAIKDSIEIKKELDVIEKKLMNWLGRSLFEEFFTITVSNLSVAHINHADSLKLIAGKDSIFSLLKISEEINPEHYIDACCAYMKTEAYRNFLEPSSKTFEAFNKIEKNLDIFSDEYNFSLLMPGKVVYSNAEVTKLDTLSWKLTAYKYFFHDYQICARSRVTNIWTYWVTGVFIFFVILGFLVYRKK